MFVERRFIEENDLLPVLFSKLWDSNAARWKKGISIPTIERGFIEFDKIRKIDLDSDTNFISLQVDWHDRFKAAEWANNLAESLNNEFRNRAIANAGASLGNLREELGKTVDVAAREAISRLMESEIEKRMLANVTPEFAVRIVDKATVADPDLPQRPNRPLMTGIGMVLGLLGGIVGSLLLYRRELASQGLL